MNNTPLIHPLSPGEIIRSGDYRRLKPNGIWEEVAEVRGDLRVDPESSVEYARKSLPSADDILKIVKGEMPAPSILKRPVSTEEAEELIKAIQDDMLSDEADTSLPPPPSGQWHRDDFTVADCPSPWRPLLLGEKQTGEILIEGRWCPLADLTGFKDSSCPGAQPGEPKQRTKAPLP